MSIIRSEDSHKWINAFVAIISVLAGFIAIRFVEFTGQWFELEARIDYFLIITQGLGIAVGLGTFAWIKKNKTSSEHLKEVYAELVRVVWPDRETVIKLSIGIMIGVAIISGILLVIDFISRELLDLIY